LPRPGIRISLAPGYALDPNEDATDLREDAVAVAKSSELVLLFLGLPASYEAEGRDRTTIELPAEQVRLVKAVAAVNPRVIVGLSNGSAVTTADWRDAVGSIVEFWLTGQAHGDSIVDVLLGEVNPSGKLAETVPVQLEDTSSYLDFPGEFGHVRYSEGVHVGYRWFDARRLEVDYPFDHGLSYTTFEYADLQITVHDLESVVGLALHKLIEERGGIKGRVGDLLSDPVSDPTALTVSMALTNSGDRRGVDWEARKLGDADQRKDQRRVLDCGGGSGAS
jgi:beta-glucosidase